MTISSLCDGLSLSHNYYKGRNRPIRGLCYHTAQCPTEIGRARFIMDFLQPQGRGASAHYGVDQTQIWAGVHEEDTAWAAPGFNADGIHMELAAFAEYGSGPIPTHTDYHRRWHDFYDGTWPSWDDPEVLQMLVNKVVPLSVDICRRNNIPPVLLDPFGLQDPTARGITQHIWCTEAFGGSHWDCGPQFPINFVVSQVAATMLGDQPFTPVEIDEDHMQLFREKGSTNIYLVRAGKKILLTKAYEPALSAPGFQNDWNVWKNEYLKELFNAGQLTTDPNKIPDIGWQAMFLIPNEVA